MDKLRRDFNNLEKKKPEKQRNKLIPSLSEIASKAGCILLKDSKVVTFCSNNLAFTPSKPVTFSKDPEFVVAVRGLGKIERWTGSENLVTTEFLVPNTIITYNKLMSRVDRYDQLKAVSTFIRKERQLSMKILFFCLEITCSNASYFFYFLEKDPSKKIADFREFKRILILRMAPRVSNSSKESDDAASSARAAPEEQRNDNSAAKSDEIKHLL